MHRELLLDKTMQGRCLQKKKKERKKEANLSIHSAFGVSWQLFSPF